MTTTTTTAFASLPTPPYYAVIFSSLRTPGDEGYAHMAARMVFWARKVRAGLMALASP
jgi:glutamate/tyrosine decarboxylase-like PLP-dependent enzyme